MTDDHAHRYQLGDPVDRVVEGRCPCGAVKQFEAYLPAGTYYRSHPVGRETNAQREESTALLSHARSLLAEPR